MDATDAVRKMATAIQSKNLEQFQSSLNVVKNSIQDSSSDESQTILNDLVNQLRFGHQQTMLHNAASVGAPSLVKELLQLGANPNLEDYAGNTALHSVCDRFQEETKDDFIAVVDLLLQHPKTDTELRNKGFPKIGAGRIAYPVPEWEKQYRKEHGFTPLGWSVKCGAIPIVQHLILRIKDKMSGSDFGALLQAACQENYFDPNGIQRELIEVLLSYEEIDINQPDAEGTTALMFVCKNCMHVHLQESVRYLIEKGANTAAKNPLGSTALFFLVSRSDSDIRRVNRNVVETVQYLIRDAGAEADACDNNGVSLLQFFCGRAESMNKRAVEIIQCLVDNGANVEARDNSGKTALHHLCRGWRDSHDVLDALLKNSNSPDFINLADDQGVTPLISALGFEKFAFAMTLLEQQGVDIDAKVPTFEASAIHVACVSKDVGIVKKLVEKNANFNTVDANGNTPLHYAAASGNWGVTQLLMEQDGVQKATLNNEGLSPLLCAAAQPNTSLDLLFNMMLHSGGTGALPLHEGN